MRVTVQSLSNEDHLPLTIGKTRVYVDGKEVSEVVEADTDEGWVEVYSGDRSSRGLEDLEFENGKVRIKRERIYGKVELKYDENMNKDIYDRMP